MLASVTSPSMRNSEAVATTSTATGLPSFPGSLQSADCLELCSASRLSPAAARTPRAPPLSRPLASQVKATDSVDIAAPETKVQMQAVFTCTLLDPRVSESHTMGSTFPVRRGARSWQIGSFHVYSVTLLGSQSRKKRIFNEARTPGLLSSRCQTGARNTSQSSYARRCQGRQRPER